MAGSYRSKYARIFRDAMIPVPSAELLAGLDMNPHVKRIRKFGYNANVGTAAFEPIWAYSGETYPYPASAVQVYLSSSNGADNQQITIEGLDSNWARQTETVTLNGVAFIPTANLYRRVYRAYNVSATAFAGTVYISTNNTDAGGDGIPDVTTSIIGIIPSVDQQTQMALYTVPANTMAHIRSYAVSVHSDNSATVRQAECRLRIRDLNNNGVFRVKDSVLVSTSGSSFIYSPFGDVIEGPADIELQAQSATTASDVAGTIWIDEYDVE